MSDEYDPRIDMELSMALAERVLAEPKKCFINAAMALLDPMLDGKRPFYIEGFAVVRSEINGEYAGTTRTEHAWLEVGGLVVEPSLVPLVSALCGVGVETAFQIAYFPGARYSRDSLMRAILGEPKVEKKGVLPVTWRVYGKFGQGHPVYSEARLRSWREYTGDPNAELPEDEIDDNPPELL